METSFLFVNIFDKRMLSNRGQSILCMSFCYIWFWAAFTIGDWLCRHIILPPNPLSMLTVAIPVAQELIMVSKAEIRGICTVTDAGRYGNDRFVYFVLPIQMPMRLPFPLLQPLHWICEYQAKRQSNGGCRKHRYHKCDLHSPRIIRQNPTAIASATGISGSPVQIVTNPCCLVYFHAYNMRAVSWYCVGIIGRIALLVLCHSCGQSNWLRSYNVLKISRIVQPFSLCKNNFRNPVRNCLW